MVRESTPARKMSGLPRTAALDPRASCEPSLSRRAGSAAAASTDLGVSGAESHAPGEGLPPWPVELQALRGRLPDPVLAAAAQRARALGVGGDEVLIASGQLDADTIAIAVADHLGLALDPLSGPLPIPPEHVPAAIRMGMVIRSKDGPPAYTVAAGGRAMRRLVHARERDPGLGDRVRLAPAPALRAWLRHQASADLAHGAAFALKERAPHMSAATLHPALLVRMAVALIGALILIALAADTVAALIGLEIVLALIFLGAVGLRLAACLVPPLVPLACPVSDRDLPVYTVIVPLYREAAVLARLEQALRALDYPPEKLDIKLVVEPDDEETLSALAGRRLPPWFEVVVAPALGPRTKPKALNAALPLARGSLVAIFDAEDVPEPGQLKEALAAFQRGGPKVACVQARLAVDNAQDSWISAHFAAEYAVHFDVFVPALAAFGLPILLGGTSNHFRRSVLEQLGGWDPYNVTEDADLGLRLARAGWRTEVIASTTQEEAPISVRAWVRQRTRWMKGWAQTALVHGRHPVRLLRALGLYRTLGVALLVLVPFVAALLFPLCLGMVLYQAATGILGYPVSGLARTVAAAASHSVLVFGYGGLAVACFEGWRRRPLVPLLPILLTLPAYWLLQTVAAWRALRELVRDPYRWDKTQHGVSPRKRAAAAKRAAPLKNSA